MIAPAVTVTPVCKELRKELLEVLCCRVVVCCLQVGLPFQWHRHD